MRKTDEDWMRECLRLARRGEGHVSPNPLVGSVLVRNGRLLSSGSHRKFGGPHAEAECLLRFTGRTDGATLYVSLEPCNHHGKTPPCTESILRSGVRRVVVGIVDPNPLVSGNGIAKLRRSGIEVRTGVLAEQCTAANAAFIKYMRTGLPLVNLKVASTIDGKMAVRGPSVSSGPSRRLVHRWRSTYDAVLVGAGTILKDNPRLTVRMVHGRNPRIVILDGRLRVPRTARVFALNPERVLLLTSNKAAQRRVRHVKELQAAGAEVVPLNATSGQIPVPLLLKTIADRGIISVLVEGGPDTAGTIARSGLIDILTVFTAPTVGGGLIHGFRAARPSFDRFMIPSAVSARPIGGDLVATYAFQGVSDVYRNHH